jgi:hypothetical protein
MFDSKTLTLFFSRKYFDGHRQNLWRFDDDSMMKALDQRKKGHDRRISPGSELETRAWLQGAVEWIQL